MRRASQTATQGQEAAQLPCHYFCVRSCKVGLLLYECVDVCGCVCPLGNATMGVKGLKYFMVTSQISLAFMHECDR